MAAKVTAWLQWWQCACQGDIVAAMVTLCLPRWHCGCNGDSVAAKGQQQVSSPGGAGGIEQGPGVIFRHSKEKLNLSRAGELQ